VIYLQRIPGMPLSKCIRMLWYTSAAIPSTVPAHRQRVLPSGCAQVIFNLSRDYLLDCTEGGPDQRSAPSLIVGARSVYEIVDSSDMADLIGIVFQPGGMAPFFRETAHAFSNRSIALEDVWGSRAVGLRERLQECTTPEAKLATLEVALREEVSSRGFLDPRPSRNLIVEFALREFAGAPVAASIRDVAARTGWSERRFSQIFREEVGMSPKVWCRIQRFQRAVRQLHSGGDLPWTDLALQCGYYDQAHFSNDFRAFSGINPTTYSAGRTQWANHVALD
jgi:AraC-like DNA-binding protein